MIHHHYDSVIFDLDGTLLDTLEDLTSAVNHALRTGGYPEHTIDDIRTFVGNGVGMLIRRALPQSADSDNEAFSETLQAFKHYYASHNNDTTAPYHGITQMLDSLQKAGIQMAIVSNKNDPNVKALNKVYFSQWIDLAIGETDGIRRKPHPDSLMKAMETLKVSPSRTLYVGDSDVDVQTAANAGVDCAAVCWGFQTESELRAAGAAVLITEPSQLLPLVIG